MVRAAGRGLVGAGGVLELCPCGSRYALTARALPLRFALLAHGLGFALTTIKWIHLLQLNEFIYFALQILWIPLQNLWIHKSNEFIGKWIHLFEKKKNPAWEVNNVLSYHIPYTLPHHTTGHKRVMLVVLLWIHLHAILVFHSSFCFFCGLERKHEAIFCISTEIQIRHIWNKWIHLIWCIYFVAKYFQSLVIKPVSIWFFQGYVCYCFHHVALPSSATTSPAGRWHSLDLLLNFISVEFI